MKKIIAMLLIGMLVFSTLNAFAATYTDKGTVKKVQQALNNAGYNCGTPDGIAGKKTYAAISSYQKDKGLAQTEQIDDALLQALGLAEASVAEQTEASAEASAATSNPSIDSSAYTRINDGSVPQMPASLVELTGGIPDSLDVLRDRYDPDYLKSEYSKWEPVAKEMMDALEETGTAVIPDFLITPGAVIELSYNYKDALFALDRKDDQLTVTLHTPLEKNDDDVFQLVFDSAGMQVPGFRYKSTRKYHEGETDVSYSFSNLAYYEYGEDEVLYDIGTQSGKYYIHAGNAHETWFGRYDGEGNLNSVSYGDFTIAWEDYSMVQ